MMNQIMLLFHCQKTTSGYNVPAIGFEPKNLILFDIYFI
jgi:hypothetical protein